MNYGNVIVAVAIIMLITQSVWIWRLTKNFHRLSGMLSRANAKVAQHKLLVEELRDLIEDDAHLDKCLQDEVDGKIFTRAQEVEYEQNKERGEDEIPWIPKEPK